MIHRTLFLLLVLLVLACTGTIDADKQAQSADTKSPPTNNVEILRNFLQQQVGKQILFGHQDALAYGVEWKYEKGRTDVNDLVGDAPAVFGWDIGNIAHEKNLDSVPFTWMRARIIDAFQQGAISTISWHTFSPVDGKSSWETDQPVVKHILPEAKHHEAFKKQLDTVAEFLLSLHTEKGTRVPIIFRPFHENNGSWFWWGQNHCTAEEYQTLFRFTINYLQQKGVDNMLVAYSPDRAFDSESTYLERYPGDDVVDIIGLDDYHDFKVEGGDSLVSMRLSVVSKLAQQKGKIAVFSETGYEGVKDSTWFTQRLLKVLKANEHTRKIAYVLVWRNYDEKHHYLPYNAAHPAANDFKKFYADNITAFHNEAKVPYNYSD